jgi:hypothetical protein
MCSSRGFLRSRVCDRHVGSSITLPRVSLDVRGCIAFPLRAVNVLFVIASFGCGVRADHWVGVVTSRAIAQTKPASSRAMATTTLLVGSLLAARRR